MLNTITSRFKAAFSRRQRGAAMTEFLVATPALLLLGLSGIQSFQFYNAKTTLNYATFEAARTGAVTHAQSNRMRTELGVRLAPIYGGDGSAAGALNAIQRASTDVQDRRFTQIEILNPTQEAFNDFGEDNKDTGQKELPNDSLRYRSREVGSTSGVNIQDANLLKIKVTYGYELNVPLVGGLLTTTLAKVNPRNAVYYNAGRIPIESVATVRLQSVAWQDSNGDAGGSGGGGTVPAGDAGNGQPPTEGNTDPANPEGNGGNPTDGQGGGAPGSTDGLIPVSGNGTPVEGVWDGSRTPDVGVDDGSVLTPPPDTINCETQYASQGDGFVDKLTGVASDILNFASGLIQGLKNQGEDLLNALADPIGTFNSAKELAKALVDDPIGTTTLIAEALGKDINTLIGCGPYDQGRVIGEYLSPAVAIKIGTKLAKFGGDVRKAINELKKEGEFKKPGCPRTGPPVGTASFIAGTPIWTPDGKRPIEQLTVGQRVLSRNAKDFSDQAQTIKELFSRTAPGYQLLVTETETYWVTEEHPLWVQGKGWTPVKEIEPGTVLASIDGDQVVRQNSYQPTPIKVHNFSVDQTPSYFVGHAGLWAHNAGVDCFDFGSLVTEKQGDSFTPAIADEYKAISETVVPFERRTTSPLKKGDAYKKPVLEDKYGPGSKTYFLNTPRDIKLKSKNGEASKKIGEISSITTDANGKTIRVTLGTGDVVAYKVNGQPDFSDYLYQGINDSGDPITNTVYIELSKDFSKNDRGRQIDIDNASKAAGFTVGKNRSNPLPDGYTWHHNEAVGKMELVRTDVHVAAQHSGGRNVLKQSLQ